MEHALVRAACVSVLAGCALLNLLGLVLLGRHVERSAPSGGRARTVVAGATLGVGLLGVPAALVIGGTLGTLVALPAEVILGPHALPYVWWWGASMVAWFVVLAFARLGAAVGRQLVTVGPPPPSEAVASAGPIPGWSSAALMALLAGLAFAAGRATAPPQVRTVTVAAAPAPRPAGWTTDGLQLAIDPSWAGGWLIAPRAEGAIWKAEIGAAPELLLPAGEYLGLVLVKDGIEPVVAAERVLEVTRVLAAPVGAGPAAEPATPPPS